MIRSVVTFESTEAPSFYKVSKSPRYQVAVDSRQSFKVPRFRDFNFDVIMIFKI